MSDQGDQKVMSHPDPVAISRVSCSAVFENGEVFPIVGWLDGDGESCDPDDALYCIVGLHDGCLLVNLRLYKRESIQ